MIPIRAFASRRWLVTTGLLVTMLGACSGGGASADTAVTLVPDTGTVATARALTMTMATLSQGEVSFSSDGSTQSCTTSCVKSYADGSTVVLAASASTGYTFTGWGGACSGTGVCTVSLSADKAVTASFAAVSVAAGKTYYVAPTGSDSAAGTSLTAPFKTIGKALNVVAAGDVVEVRAGTYNETLAPRTAGSPGAWITVRGYNGERPVIRGSGAGPTVYFYRDECDEDVIGTASGNTDCKAMYWVLQGLDIRGSASGGGDGNAVKIDTPKVKLVGNKLCCSVADGVKLVRTANDVELRDNEIWQDKAITVPSTNAQGIDIVGADRTIVAGNYLHDIPDIAMYAKVNARNTVFENNLLVNIGGSTNGHAMMLGQSTDFDRMVDGTYESYDGVIRNNVVINATWSCVATASSQRVKIYNNSCYNTGTSVHGSILISNEAETGQAGTDIEIYNNVIYGSANTPVLKMASDAMTDYATLKVDRNIYWVGGADPKFTVEDKGLYTVGSASWKTNYKGFGGRTDASLVADPKFANTSVTAGAAALTLQAGSPAINAGLTDATVVPTDRLGVTRPQGGASDIGAFEY